MRRRFPVASIWLPMALLGALAVRLYGIDRSLWLDEFSTLWCVEEGWRAIASRVAAFQGQTPLYYYAARLSIDVFGESEVALRLPSLLASAGTALFCAMAAYLLAGRAAGIWAGMFAWLAFAHVQTGVNARPYALALLGVAAAIAGVVGAGTIGHTRWRLLFIAGTVVAFWAHFAITLGILGAAAGLARPAVRTRYTLRRLAVDGLAIAALCAPAWPYLWASVGRTHHGDWLPSPQHGDSALLLAPLVLPVALVLTGRHGEFAPVERVLLWAIAAPIVLIELAWFTTGMNLVTARYLGQIVAPAAVLAGVCAVRLTAPERRLAAVSFLAITCGSYVQTWRATGSASGLGVEDWRTAVAETRHLLRERPALVLYRSGFREEDLPPLGHPPPATRSPLRGPGDLPFPPGVASLTHTWQVAGRRRYFEEHLRPRVANAGRVIVLSQRAGLAEGNYADLTAEWCRQVLGEDSLVNSIPAGRGIDLRLVTQSDAR